LHSRAAGLNAALLVDSIVVFVFAGAVGAVALMWPPRTQRTQPGFS
jgi:hypothetical protein